MLSIKYVDEEFFKEEWETVEQNLTSKLLVHCKLRVVKIRNSFASTSALEWFMNTVQTFKSFHSNFLQKSKAKVSQIYLEHKIHSHIYLLCLLLKKYYLFC